MSVTAIEQRVRGMIGRAIVRLIDDERKAQELQVDLLEDESQDGVEHLHPYGFTHHPHPDAEAIVVHPGGLRSHAITLVVADRRYRMKQLKQGEVALYDDLGNHVLLGREAITINAVGDMIVNVAGNLTADVKGDADVNVDGDTTAHVGGNLSATIDGDADATISGAATAHVEGDLTVNADANADITVGAAATVDIAADATLTIGGAVSADVTGNASLTIGGTTTADVAGDVTVHSGGTALVDAASATVKASGAARLEAGGACTVKGASVTVDSANVMLGGGGGQAVARVGDDVDLGTGKILSGSGTVKAV